MPVYNLCRICLLEDTNAKAIPMQPLFDDDNSRCVEIVEKIEECGGIVLKPHEEFPKMICYQCLESLNTSYKFRSMCQASEHALLDAIVKSELKTEPQESTTPLTDASRLDNQGDIFFDMQTEFIDVEEVTGADRRDFTEVEDSGSEFPADSDSEASDAKTVKTAKEITAIRKIKASPKRKLAKRGRPRKVRTFSTENQPEPNKVKPGRGRKKLDVPPASIMCEICGNIYTNRNLLNLHMRRHLSQKPFECEICGKSFACPSDISRHMRVHTGEKPYVCKFCGRTFADRSTIIKHERIHTNERPFSCKTCGKSFTYSNVLKNHMLTHTGEKPFPCLSCNKTFPRKDQLDQHCSTLTHQHTVKNRSMETK